MPNLRLVFWVGCLGAVVTLAACSSSHGPSATPVAAYVGTDVCSGHTDATSCASDTANACQWAALGITCPAGSTCPDGFCHTSGPCEQHGDETSCTADTANDCAWAGLAADLAYCPNGSTSCSTSSGGYCYAKSAQTGGGCACACPLYCPQGSDCPPCECDCPPPPPPADGGTGIGPGGGMCTCACPTCAPGETCPPCSCNCSTPDAGGGDTCGQTCACSCPVCPAGQTCPPCSCSCQDGGVTTLDGGAAPGPVVCNCPTCTPGQPCPACDCSPDAGQTTTDPCSAHTDSQSCTGDTANECHWFALGIPCQIGQPCISGVCQQVLNQPADAGTSGGSVGGCVCGCPACAPGETCPPCGCDCTGGTGCAGTGYVDGGVVVLDGGAAPDAG